MKEPVIVHTDIKSLVRLEDEYDFSVRMSIGLAEGGDFFLIIEFPNLTMDEIGVLVSLIKLKRRLSIKSDFFDQEQYPIRHVILIRMAANDNRMTWECLSDYPKHLR